MKNAALTSVLVAALWTPCITATLHAQEPLPPVEAETAIEPDIDHLLNMDIEQLSQTQVQVHGLAPATLTGAPDQSHASLPPGYVVPPVDRTTPAAVTRIDYDQIRASGARSLNELFDIYVPNTQVIRHHYSQDHVAPRGLVSDAEDKYLLLVNGKVMNQRTFEGATSERDLPMLTDIHHIDFIRGPGSSVYGPGAIAGVISIVTHNGLTFQGTEVAARQGVIDAFSSLEIRHGKKLDDETGLFFYYGAADISGADITESPVVFGSDIETPIPDPDIVAGEPIPFNVANDRRAYRSKAKHKAHAQFDCGNYSAWVRYTRGGHQSAAPRDHLSVPPVGFFDPNFPLNFVNPIQFGYQQFTVFNKYDYEWSETLQTNFRLSYDFFDFERGQGESLWQHHSEDEYYGRALTTWTPNEEHSVAFGAELSREKFGLPSPGFPHLPAVTAYTNNADTWYTSMFSLLAEYRWRPNDYWTFFLGTRQDEHTYTEWLSSPRGVIVFTPNDVDTIKFIASQAVRKLPDGLLRAEYLANSEFADTESIDSLELRWETRPNQSWWTGVSGFVQQSEFVGYLAATDRQAVIGDVSTWGLELEAAYTVERTRFSASHGYTTLESFDLVDPTLVQGFSSMPYGFGSELANWSPHLTKFQVQQRHTQRCRSFLSSVVYWGFPGSQDYAEYDRATAAFPMTEPGYTAAFESNMYLTYGYQYDLSERTQFNFHLFNLMGWFDHRLNKRNYILGAENANYRSEAASLGFSLYTKF